jgi:hypothetical protein
VREPEGNGCVERFRRRIKEQVLGIRTFRTVEELRVTLQRFSDLHNRTWPLQKHGFLPPSQVRYKLTARQATGVRTVGLLSRRRHAVHCTAAQAE